MSIIKWNPANSAGSKLLIYASFKYHYNYGFRDGISSCYIGTNINSAALKSWLLQFFIYLSMTCSIITMLATLLMIDT